MGCKLNVPLASLRLWWSAIALRSCCCSLERIDWERKDKDANLGWLLVVEELLNILNERVVGS